MIVGAAMSVEEAFFRGFLQPRLGLALSTLLFTLAHVNYGLPFMVVAVLTISAILGALFAVRRNLLPCMVAHGVFDAIQIFLVIPFAVRQLTGQ
jgi:membrane protease YdiL (CAAX protease family)